MRLSAEGSVLAHCMWPFLWGEQALEKTGKHGDRLTARRAAVRVQAGTQVWRWPCSHDACSSARMKEKRLSWCHIFAGKSAVKHHCLSLKSGHVNGQCHILLDILLYGVLLTSFCDNCQVGVLLETRWIWGSGMVSFLQSQMGLKIHTVSFLWRQMPEKKAFWCDRWMNPSDPSGCEHFKLGGCLM